ncbi:MAG: ribosome silencing factor [Candidatus Omnitrophota bacterium]
MDLKIKAALIAEAAKDKKAEDIVLMDMRKVVAFCDYFVVMSAGNPRQIKAIADDIEERLERERIRLRRREGDSEAKWILLDYGDCLVHIFEPATREFYNLEGLWGDAPLKRLD